MQKFFGKQVSTLAAFILGLGVFYACDSKHTLIEAFLQNGAETKLFTFTSGRNYELGQSVAISGNVAIVGARGLAYIYRWDGSSWVKEANLLAGFFEHPVALNGNTAVVADDRFVEVYRFNGSRWQEETQLTASTGSTRYGSAVSVSGELIAIGNNIDRRVYLYRFNGSNWVEEARLTPSAGHEGDEFGSSVSINGDVVIVGGETMTGNNQVTGVAYVYRWTGSRWQEETIILAGDAGEGKGNEFGRAVAVSGNLAIVGGAPYDNESGENFGSAYVFRYTGSIWRQEAKLSFKVTAIGAYFGSAIAVEGNLAIIGAPFGNEGSEAGSQPGGLAYVYRWDGNVWREQKVLTASDGTSGNRFGAAVSISGRFALIGAPGNYDYQTNNGPAAYVYVLD